MRKRVSGCAGSGAMSGGTASPQGTQDLRRKLKVHNRVKVLRVERDMTRQEMADALGINYRTLGYLEREDYAPKLELAWRVSRFFDLPMDAVFSPTPFEPMHQELYGSDEQGGAGVLGGRGRSTVLGKELSG